jgi:diadenosine tetraphosphate (Ap4A) HIT family hydrolase
MEPDCFICRKNAALEAPPPGGYIYQDADWNVGHAPAHMAGLCTLVVESARHFLDFSEMTPGEAQTFGSLLGQLYRILKAETGAERIYTALFMEGAPHFHAWLVPRYPGGQVRGPALLEQASCDPASAAEVARTLRERLTVS